MSDGFYVSMMVETKLNEDGPVNEITILDKDLNLYSFRVNQKSNSFEPGNVRNISEQLQLDPNWLEFNGKEQIDFDQYKQDYKLYSAQTIGVVIKDYVVYHNIDSEALVIVDISHQAFPKVSQINATKVKMNRNIDDTDLRLMEYQD